MITLYRTYWTTSGNTISDVFFSDYSENEEGKI